jgi:hypothetical protein
MIIITKNGKKKIEYLIKNKRIQCNNFFNYIKYLHCKIILSTMMKN